MPRLVHRNRQYRHHHHKADGRAVVTVNSQGILLGRYETKASRDVYDRVISEYLANGRQLPRGTAD